MPRSSDVAPLAIAGTALAAGIVAALSGRRRTRLGAVETSRTGGIKLDWTKINRTAREAVASFVPCGPGITRPRDYPVQLPERIAVAGRPVDVVIEPNQRDSKLLVEGSATVRAVSTTVTLEPKAGLCTSPLDWRDAIRSTLVHELTHAADPYLVKRRPRPLTAEESRGGGFCAYINQPFEKTAFLNQIRGEIRSPEGRATARRLCTNSPKSVATPARTLTVSPTWREIKFCLSDEARRPFFKMAASVTKRNGKCWLPR